MKTCLVAGLLSLVACSKTPPPSPSPSTPAPALSGKLEHRMANCPTAIDEASTHVINTPDGVDVVISSPDSVMQEQIRVLSNAQAEMGDPSVGEPENTGHHGGPGTRGHCPIIHDGTLVTVTTNDDGATLHVKALDPTRVKTLQDETAARASSPMRGRQGESL